MDGSLIGFLIGFNRRPPDARACGFGFPETPAVSPVTINRRLSDACLMDGIAGMGCFDRLAGDALSIKSVAC